MFVKNYYTEQFYRWSRNVYASTNNSEYSSFWSGAAPKAVVVEADAFKERDVIYRAISSRGHHQDMLQTAELVLHMIAITRLGFYDLEPSSN